MINWDSRRSARHRCWPSRRRLSKEWLGSSTNLRCVCLSVHHFQIWWDVQSLPFSKVRHQLSTLDAQPSNEAGGILVAVTGALLVWKAPISTSQTKEAREFPEAGYNGWHAREPRLTKSNDQWIILRCFNCFQTALAVTSSSTISSSWYMHSRRSASTPKTTWT